MQIIKREIIQGMKKAQPDLIKSPLQSSNRWDKSAESPAAAG